MTIGTLPFAKAHGLNNGKRPKEIDQLFPDGEVDIDGLKNIVDVDAYKREIAVQRRLNPDATEWVVRYTAWRKTLDGENTPGPTLTAAA